MLYYHCNTLLHTSSFNQEVLFNYLLYGLITLYLACCLYVQNGVLLVCAIIKWSMDEVARVSSLTISFGLFWACFDPRSSSLVVLAYSPCQVGEFRLLLS